MIQTSETNRGQIEGWNEAVGKTWVKFQAELDTQLAGLGARTQAAAALAPGEAVLDIGCGAGATTVQIARAVAPDGRVTGVDISRRLLEVARGRPAEPGAAPIAYLEADAQTHAFPSGGFDVLHSRFGVMFFDDPAAAFANLRAAARPGGRLAFCCWRSMAENLWLTLPMKAAGHLFPPPQPATPGAPGPFALADPDRVRTILDQAGWSGIAVDPFDLDIGGLSLDDTARMMTRVGPLGAILRESAADDALKAEAEAAVWTTLTPHVTPDGVFVPSAVWIVTAQA